MTKYIEDYDPFSVLLVIGGIIVLIASIILFFHTNGFQLDWGCK